MILSEKSCNFSGSCSRPVDPSIKPERDDGMWYVGNREMLSRIVRIDRLSQSECDWSIDSHDDGGRPQGSPLQLCPLQGDLVVAPATLPAVGAALAVARFVWQRPTSPAYPRPLAGEGRVGGTAAIRNSTMPASRAAA